jgi:hypothetical protein
MFPVSRYCEVYAKGITYLFPVSRYCAVCVYCTQYIYKCTATQVEQFSAYAAYLMKNLCNSTVRFFYRCTEYRSCHGKASRLQLLMQRASQLNLFMQKANR